MKNFKKFWICLVKNCVGVFEKIWICLVKLLLWPVKKIWICLVRLCGWKLNLPKKGSRPEFERCVFVMAPHTSALDFIIGAAYLWACCSNGRVFIAKEFFFWPLGSFLRGLGCISVDRGNPTNGLVPRAVVEFSKGGPLSVVLTPEGTRKSTKKWFKGFWEIANKAGVPIVPTYVNFKTKEIGAFDTIIPTDCESDLLMVRKLYKKDMAKYPDKFIEVWKFKESTQESLSTFLIKKNRTLKSYLFHEKYFCDFTSIEADVLYINCI